MSAEEKVPEQEPEMAVAEEAGPETGEAGREPGEPGEERMRILRLLAERRITAEEAEELLSALESKAAGGPPAGWQWPPAGWRWGPPGPPPMVGAGVLAGPQAVAAPPGRGVTFRWDPPGAPRPPGPPAPPAPPYAPATPNATPVPARSPDRRGGEFALSVGFKVKDGGKELSASLPLNLARAADRYLPRAIRQYLDRFEVDLAKLLEIADATGPLDVMRVGFLELFHVKDGQTELKITLR